MYATITVTSIPKNISTMESNSKSLMKLPSLLCKQEVQTSWEGPAAREQRFFAMAKMQSLRLQAVLPVDCASSLLVPFLGRLPHGIPCTSRIADISMDCNILAAECLRCQFAPMAARFARAHREVSTRPRPILGEKPQLRAEVPPLSIRAHGSSLRSCSSRG